MEEKSTKNPAKKEMPENIRKMFEQKKKQDNNAESINLNINEIEDSNINDDQINDLNDVTINADNKNNDQVKSKKIKSETKKDLENNTKEKNKDKKKLSKKQKIIISVVASVIACVIIVVSIFLLLPKAMKLETPTLKIYNLSNQTILYVDENKEANLYGFFIQKVGESSITSLTSSTNEISIKSKLKTPGKYYIWARYISNNYQFSSEESTKITYDYYETLDTPVASLSQDESQIIFNPIKNAKEYKIYYSMSNTEMSYFTVPNSSNLENIVFDLTQLRLMPAGIYNLYVQAISDETSYYKNSQLGEVVQYINSYKLENITNASFDTNTNILSFELNPKTTNTKRFEININNGKLIQGYVSSEVKNLYNVDLTPYLSSGIAVNSLKIKALGDNNFVTDSDYIDVTIN